jgi:dTDP-4-dehydrorhamnose 3,5-epimerase-like enzyme
MGLPGMRIVEMADSGDERGSSFQTGQEWLGFLGGIDDAHSATIVPGYVRGNHYHKRRREVIAVLFADERQLAWKRSDETEVETRIFSGSGAVLLEVEPLVAHAIENSGQGLLWIVGFSHGALDPEALDSYLRKLLP